MCCKGRAPPESGFGNRGKPGLLNSLDPGPITLNSPLYRHPSCLAAESPSPQIFPSPGMRRFLPEVGSGWGTLLAETTESPERGSKPARLGPTSLSGVHPANLPERGTHPGGWGSYLPPAPNLYCRPPSLAPRDAHPLRDGKASGSPVAPIGSAFAPLTQGQVFIYWSIAIYWPIATFNTNGPIAHIGRHSDSPVRCLLPGLEVPVPICPSETLS